MKPAVINVDLAWGAACDLVLLVQDAAGVPLDLSGAALDFALKAGDASVPLAVDAAMLRTLSYNVGQNAYALDLRPVP